MDGKETISVSYTHLEFHNMLPVFENPMYTEGYEGFFHLDSMRGTVEEAHLDLSLIHILCDRSMPRTSQDGILRYCGDHWRDSGL